MRGVRVGVWGGCGGWLEWSEGEKVRMKEFSEK